VELPQRRMSISLRLAYFARRVAFFFASYPRALFGQNEIVAGSRETRRSCEKFAECKGNVTRAAVPHMRRQRSGCILQISSVGGRLTRPGSTPYHAAKWAVGGFTESLAQELSPFGVKVCALEPGGMRTNWGARANQDTPELLPDYEPSVSAVAKALKSYWGKGSATPSRWLRLCSVWGRATAFRRTC
jgi:hypothetical protein